MNKKYLPAILALVLLDRYAVADPVGSNAVGVFEDQILQGLHDLLVATGSSILIDPLLVGAEIEEIDLIDIDLRKEEVIGSPVESGPA